MEGDVVGGFWGFFAGFCIVYDVQYVFTSQFLGDDGLSGTLSASDVGV